MLYHVQELLAVFFFDTMIIAKRYCKIIVQFISLLKPEEQRYCTLQQDNAVAHTATNTLNMKEFFDDRLISKNHCPPRSPDLLSADYFLGILERQGVHEYTADTERFMSEYYY